MMTQTAENRSLSRGKTVSRSDPSILDGAFDAICRGGCALRGAGRAGRMDRLGRKRADIHFAPFTAVLIRARLLPRGRRTG